MKHITNIDNVVNLQALVKHELRLLGIKVPKKKIKRNQDIVKGQLFGNYLAGVHCAHVAECGYVAKFLVDAAEIITANIDNEGVFRKSGAVSRQKEIKQQLENGSGFCGANVYDVTALVKQFFRELSEPLLTSVYHDSFIRCYQLDCPDAAKRAIMLLCLLLPAEHISTLRFIMLLLAKIAANSEKNKMDTANLSVVLAPNIMHVNSKSETMKSCEEKVLKVQTAVVELLIQNAADIGMVDNEMVDKTAFMSEVFSTDDELDASEDNLDDTKDRKQKKKRKRSGSFQGFVSSIASSFSKWRKSTDGKTNTSGLSHGSNVSHMSIPSHCRGESQAEEGLYQNQGYQLGGGVEATPVMRRNKTHIPATEGRAFSASKKKAILNQLPQHATLASTPFTPASCKKQGARRGAHDTPSIPPRPHQTPRQTMKARKKIGLFSPASTTKKKRSESCHYKDDQCLLKSVVKTTTIPYSTSNLSMHAGAGKKVSKPKGIFRRLSGSKEDQMFNDKTVCRQIGQRLAVSPTSTMKASTSMTTESKANSSVNTTTQRQRASPIAAITQSSFSSSMCEQSIMSSVSTFDDDRRSLNEGFIMTDEKEEIGDITRIMSEPAICGSHDTGEYVMISDIKPSVSDTTMLNYSELNVTPRGHSRSFSVDSCLDDSGRKGSIKRGRPNSVRAGLLNGDHHEVHKLRRSFGLDKSDIGFPIPVSVANVSDDDQYVELKDIKHRISTTKCADATGDNTAHMDAGLSKHGDDSPWSVSQTKSSISLASDITEHRDDVTSEAGYECDDESVSEAGFSTISGGTVICQPKMKLFAEPTDIDTVSFTDHVVSTDNAPPKTLAERKQESKDSLLSQVSSGMSPVMHFKKREMSRSVSADSGKGSPGSVCEDSPQAGSNVTLDSITSTVLDEKDDMMSTTTSDVAHVPEKPTVENTVDLSSTTPQPMETADKTADISGTDSVFGDVTNEVQPKIAVAGDQKKAIQPLSQKKSVSSQDLKRESEYSSTPTRVSRSKSLLETSLAQRKKNSKPNLQISAETHKLLARAGYIREPPKKQEVKSDFDFTVPPSFPFIKQAETLNPRRESIIALQKNNAGHVRNNIRQFDKITEKRVTVEERHTSPFRFPNSTSRKTKTQPVFHNSMKDIDALKQCLHPPSKDRMHFGGAKVPISTSLIKISENDTEESIADEASKCGLKRKPSIYYCDKDGVPPPASKVRNISGTLDTSSEMNDTTMSKQHDSIEPDVNGKTCDKGKQLNVLTTTPDMKASGRQLPELDQSLLDTINDVCTPLSEKVKLSSSCEKISHKNKENSLRSEKSSSTMPGIKPPIMATPLCLDTVKLRTSSNKTPVDVLKTACSPRSPIKPLKRLGSSPHSPRGRVMVSPKLIKTNRRSLLSAIASQNEDLNNL